MVGDGFECAPNPCLDQGNNGGCHHTVTCTFDHTTGKPVCGRCPAGYSGDGVLCEQDPNPCLQANGGCDLLASCMYDQGVRACGSCPEGFKGTGETACRAPVESCATGHGGCDAQTTCRDDEAGPVCGPCPAGYDGTGATTCVDHDACADQPCFPGVSCTDLPPPAGALGFECGQCPEGYRGDGSHCEACSLRVRIDSTTALGGNQGAPLMMRRVYDNRVIGVSDGLEQDCVSTQGMTFEWSGWSGSDGASLQLDREVHKVNTPRLFLPQDSLQVEVYHLRLTAWLTGAPELHASASLTIHVTLLPLEVHIAGGSLSTSSSTLIRLDASSSYDPNGDDGPPLTFSWTCASDSVDGICFHAAPASDAAALPAVISVESWAPCSEGVRPTCAVLELYLPGAEAAPSTGSGGHQAGRRYTFWCTVAKGERRAEAQTDVVVYDDKPELPFIVMAPSQTVMDPKSSTTLSAHVTSAHGNLKVLWEVSNSSKAAVTPLDLAAVTLTSLHQPVLVLEGGSLRPGWEYNFRLTASDSAGSSSAVMKVRVNRPPRCCAGAVTGTGLSISPGGVPPARGGRWRWRDDGVVTGVVLEEEFVVVAEGWEDDPDDLPLQYMLTYEVLVNSGRARTLLEYTPSTRQAFVAPQVGLAEQNHNVTLWLHTRDMLGASSTAWALIEVTPGAPIDTPQEQDLYIEQLLARGQEEMAAGAEEAAFILVDGVAACLNDAESEGRGGTQPARQRAAALELARDLITALPITASSTDRFAESVSQLVAQPEQLANASFHMALDLLQSLTAAPAATSAAAATSICTALSSLVLVPTANGTRDAGYAAAALAALSSLAHVLAEGLSPGQQPARVQAEQLAASAQVATTDPTFSQLFTETMVGSPLLSASNDEEVPPALSLPQTMAETVAAAIEVQTVLLLSRTDPHSGGAAGVKAVAASGLVEILLEDTGSGEEIPVRDLEVALHISLPLLPQGAAAAASDLAEAEGNLGCWWWDPTQGEYSDAGCVALPNPAPPGAGLYWRESNISVLTGLAKEVEGGDGLQRSWGFWNTTQMAHCVEDWGAVHVEYHGADAGHRKYIGDSCEVVSEGNTLDCWWVWTRARFEGPGCVHAPTQECLCTHLTEFQTLRKLEVGEVERGPGKVTIMEEKELTSTSLQDVAESSLLLIILGALMMGALVVWVMSNHFHTHERMRLATLLFNAGERSISFKPLESQEAWAAEDAGSTVLWTWTIKDNGLYFGHAYSTSGARSMWKLSLTHVKAGKGKPVKPRVAGRGRRSTLHVETPSTYSMFFKEHASLRMRASQLVTDEPLKPTTADTRDDAMTNRQDDTMADLSHDATANRQDATMADLSHDATANRQDDTMADLSHDATANRHAAKALPVPPCLGSPHSECGGATSDNAEAELPNGQTPPSTVVSF
ncbi:hypothetical protein CYMTET_52336 [Cymbomonas tetramitiformis]|uniref:EGF-like domain-containing protein n=1 Tax=Cymbomonas tetramitiformis TaxID=36881 RepID=A0AAE0BKN4_9CHLO|nr:hypothetical protein CYMTET_52336 [Cymbomonas tetramitiformis]